jgi:hypothetical protein
MPGAASSLRSRTTRCAARSRAVHPSHNVGESGPTSLIVATRAARSRWAAVMPNLKARREPATTGGRAVGDGPPTGATQAGAREEGLRSAFKPGITLD